MQLRLSKQRNHALTLMEVLVVIAIVVLLATLFLPAFAVAKRKHSRIGCVNNLKQIVIAFRLWAGDNFDKYPMQLSVTNGGAMELAGNALQPFLVMSNELSTPKILYCPDDAAHFETDSFIGITSSNISYFVNVDVRESYPQMILVGDDNFEIGGVPVKSGILEISSNTPIAWSAARHKFVGNIGLADGSVQQVTQNGLHQTLQETGVTNHLAIP